MKLVKSILKRALMKSDPGFAVVNHKKRRVKFKKDIIIT